MNDTKFIAIIPARGGSKRLPRKNLLQLAGKPLIGWTIEAALESQNLSRVIVSTDDTEIAEVAQQFGAEVPFMRSQALASDLATTVDVVEDVIRRVADIEFKHIVLLQPTTPLRTAKHIDEAIELYRRVEACAVVGVSEMEHPVEWSNVLPEDGRMDSFLDESVMNKRSQDLPTRYRINGAIYVSDAGRLLNEHSLLFRSGTYAYRMQRECSVDIDDRIDFMVAEVLMQEKLH